MTDHEAYVAFNMVPDVGAVKVAALARAHGGVAAAWEAFDGKTDWQTVTLPISGKTTVRWSFYRDDWDEPGASHENAAWVDGITFAKED